jgi:hypothetical protein
MPSDVVDLAATRVPEGSRLYGFAPVGDRPGWQGGRLVRPQNDCYRLGRNAAAKQTDGE